MNWFLIVSLIKGHMIVGLFVCHIYWLALLCDWVSALGALLMRLPMLCAGGLYDSCQNLLGIHAMIEDGAHVG